MSAVAYLHKKGLVHRDLKVEKIVVDELDVAKLSDLSTVAPVNEFGLGLGTVPYMSPERFEASVCFIIFLVLLSSSETKMQGKLAASQADDVWALGVVLYVLLTGYFPWKQPSSDDKEYNAYRKHGFPNTHWRCLSAFSSQVQLINQSIK